MSNKPNTKKTQDQGGHSDTQRDEPNYLAVASVLDCWTRRGRRCRSSHLGGRRVKLIVRVGSGRDRICRSVRHTNPSTV